MAFCWQFTTREPILHFLPAAARILKGQNTVCFEHRWPLDEALELYSRFPSHHQYVPERDTIGPRSQLFYCQLVPEFTSELVRLGNRFDLSLLLCTMRGYDRERLIFYSHDACDGLPVLVTPRYPEGLVRQLAEESQCEAIAADTSINWNISKVGSCSRSSSS